MSTLCLPKWQSLSLVILLALNSLTACKVDENGKVVNNYPIAAAGVDQVVASGASVILDGKASTDSDGQIMLYAWQQVDGPPATLPYNPAPQLTFTAPDTDHDIALTFRLTVVDDVGFKGTDLMVVQVKAKPNQLPSASAGLDQAVSAATVVILNASASQDKDGQIIGYSWQQISGTPVTLSNAQTVQPSFTAPEVKADETLVFEVVVKDNRGATATDQIAIQIKVTEPILVGQFISSTGGVAGLNYSTATQVGQTNTKGEFNYKVGETVTFKIGEFTIGSSLANTKLSPFDLLGIKPPVSAAETSAELRLLVRSEKTTPFETANNMATFLQTLDEDSDLANGILIPETIKPLIKSSTLDFTLNTGAEFANNAQFKYLLGKARAAGIWSGKKAIRDPNKALDSLYAGLNLVPTIPKKSYYKSFDGYIYTYDFDPTANQLIYQAKEYKNYSERKVSNFDPLGKLKGVEFYNDSKQARTFANYANSIMLPNESGYTQSESYTVKPEYATIGNMETTSNYDNNGNLIEQLIKQDGKITKQVSHTYLYDDKGNIKQDAEINSTGSALTTKTYHENNVLLGSISEAFDSNKYIKSRFTYTYDPIQLKYSDNREFNNNTDNTLDSSQVINVVLDKNGMALQRDIERYDLYAKVLTYKEKDLADFNSDYKMTKRTRAIDSTGMGSNKKFWDSSISENALSRVERLEVYNDGQATPFAIATETTTLDTNGNEITHESKSVIPDSYPVQAVEWRYKDYNQWFPAESSYYQRSF